MTQVIPLGGPEAKRYFAPAAETTARQDGWIMVQISDAGIMKFHGKALDEVTGLAVVAEIYRSGKFHHLLAGMLVEQGVKWTPAEAEKNAEWFAEITDPESKEVMRTRLVELLANFFLPATPSSAPSPSVSGKRKAPPKRRSTNGDAPSTEAAAPVPAASGSDAPGS